MTIENEEPPTLTKYGRMRERYLREHRKILYINLLTSGKLYEHLADIDTSACDMAEYLIKEMARKQGVTEELKGKDMMKWIGLMNNIRACADEIVLNDIVYPERRRPQAGTSTVQSFTRWKLPLSRVQSKNRRSRFTTTSGKSSSPAASPVSRSRSSMKPIPKFGRRNCSQRCVPVRCVCLWAAPSRWVPG